MGRVVIIGGGVAGLAAALAFGDAGSEVTVVERDDVTLPGSPDDAFEHWPRRGAPQVHHSHAFLALLRNLLRDQHPDLLASLLANGATELRFTESLPDTMIDTEARDGDDDLVAIACRRTTFEWVLRRHVLAGGGVRLVQGVVDRLLTGDSVVAGVPHVVGVGLNDGSEHRGDWVIDASGRRSPLPALLAPFGGPPLVEREEDTGIVYSSRFYRLRPGQEVPEVAGPAAGDLGYLKFAVFIGDNRTFSVTFGVPTDDRDLRALLHEDGFSVATRAIPALAPWVEPALADAITGVEVMARLLNRRREFLVDSDPVATGVLAIGDAHTCTNPLYGRGCSLGFLAAHLAAAAVDSAGPTGWRDGAIAFEAAMRERVHPWYVAAVAQDRRSRAQSVGAPDRGRRDDTVDDAALGLSAEDVESLLRDGLLPATRTDPVVFRAFLRAFNLLDPPDTLLQDGEVLGRVLAVWQERDTRPAPAPMGPDRAELLALLAER